jgi:hypothetical protein
VDHRVGTGFCGGQVMDHWCGNGRSLVGKLWLIDRVSCGLLVDH